MSLSLFDFHFMVLLKTLFGSGKGYCSRAGPQVWASLLFAEAETCAATCWVSFSCS